MLIFNVKVSVFVCTCVCVYIWKCFVCVYVCLDYAVDCPVCGIACPNILFHFLFILPVCVCVCVCTHDEAAWLSAK